MKYNILFLFTISIATINGQIGPGEQEFGFVNIREGVDMFWWFYHTMADVGDSSERPIILWLHGGPGRSSSGEGNFMYAGPLDEYLREREDHWVKDFNMLYIDSPVGSGFSQINNFSLLNKYNTEAAIDLLDVVRYFFDKFPQFVRTPFYVFGFEYGAKIGIEFVQLLVEEINEGNMDVNIKAMSASAPWISPGDQLLSAPEYLYQFGILDDYGKAKVQNVAEDVQKNIDIEDYEEAMYGFFDFQFVLDTVTDGVDHGNILYPDVDFYKNIKDEKIDLKEMKKVSSEYFISEYTPSDDAHLRVIMNGAVRRALNMTNDTAWGLADKLVYYSLHDDYMRPVIDMVEGILNNTDIEIHICSGNLDLFGNTPGQINWINDLKWINKNEFQNARRNSMWVNNTLEGYYKKGGGLSFYWINASGRKTVTDSPRGMREFLKLMTGY